MDAHNAKEARIRCGQVRMGVIIDKLRRKDRPEDDKNEVMCYHLPTLYIRFTNS